MWGSRDSRKKVATWLVYKDPQVVSSNTKTLCKTQPRKTHPTRRHNNNPLSLVVFFFGEASITHTHTHPGHSTINQECNCWTTNSWIGRGVNESSKGAESSAMRRKMSNEWDLRLSRNNHGSMIPFTPPYPMLNCSSDQHRPTQPNYCILWILPICCSIRYQLDSNNDDDEDDEDENDNKNNYSNQCHPLATFHSFPHLLEPSRRHHDDISRSSSSSSSRFAARRKHLQSTTTATAKQCLVSSR